MTRINRVAARVVLPALILAGCSAAAASFTHSPASGTSTERAGRARGASGAARMPVPKATPALQGALGQRPLSPAARRARIERAEALLRPARRGPTAVPAHSDFPFGLEELDLPEVDTLAEARLTLDYELPTMQGLPEGCVELAAELEPLLSFMHAPDAAVSVTYDCPTGLVNVRLSPPDTAPLSPMDFLSDTAETEYGLVDGTVGRLRTAPDGWRELKFPVPTGHVVVDAYWPAADLAAVAEAMRVQPVDAAR